MEEANDPKQIVSHVFGTQGAELFENLLNQKPEEADAIVFLQGDRFDRAPKVVSLYKQKYANRILVVGNNVLIGKGKRPDEDNVALDEMVEYVVRHGIPSKAVLVEDGAINTLGQARATVQLAKEKKWNTLLIVVSPYALLRSFLTFAKQVQDQKWKGNIIFQSADLSWNNIPSGRTKTALEVLRMELEKIRAYQKDMITVEHGILFMKDTGEKCLIRVVKQEDSKRIWEIRNSPLVREYSTSNNVISFENHVQWLEERYFRGKKNLCFVIECQREVVGYCRFDFDEMHQTYTVSIAIDPTYHGKGLGHQLLSTSLSHIPQTSVVNAAVRKGNPVSLALLKKNNFAIDREDEQYYYFSFTQGA